ncbi:MAG: hypothetical protein M3Z17_04320, partial [Gemmatimonadota bacterium]|nr:hypothetical protein [Gemmatimonadota bacterium]
MAERANSAFVIFATYAMILFNPKCTGGAVFALLAASTFYFAPAAVAQATGTPPVTPPMVVLPGRTTTSPMAVSLDQAVR